MAKTGHLLCTGLRGAVAVTGGVLNWTLCTNFCSGMAEAIRSRPRLAVKREGVPSPDGTLGQPTEKRDAPCREYRHRLTQRKRFGRLWRSAVTVIPKRPSSIWGFNE